MPPNLGTSIPTFDQHSNLRAEIPAFEVPADLRAPIPAFGDVQESLRIFHPPFSTSTNLWGLESAKADLLWPPRKIKADLLASGAVRLSIISE
jgi:hypothetical protein